MKSISTILREIDQIKRSDIREELKAKFLAQKEAELEQVGQALPAAKTATEAPPTPPKNTK